MKSWGEWAIKRKLQRKQLAQVKADLLAKAEESRKHFEQIDRGLMILDLIHKGYSLKDIHPLHLTPQSANPS